MAVRYVPLTAIFPLTSRATLWRWRKARKIPPPDLVINGREFYLESRFAPRDDDADQAEGELTEAAAQDQA
jgi:hypothetical protein